MNMVKNIKFCNNQRIIKFDGRHKMVETIPYSQQNIISRNLQTIHDGNNASMRKAISVTPIKSILFVI